MNKRTGLILCGGQVLACGLATFRSSCGLVYLMPRRSDLTPADDDVRSLIQRNCPFDQPAPRPLQLVRGNRLAQRRDHGVPS